MRSITLFAFYGFLLISQLAAGQLVFKDNEYQLKDPKGLIPYGERIAINGKNKGLIALSLTMYFLTQSQTVKISVHPDGSWDGILDPLPAKTRVVFKFTELRKVTEEDKQKVRTTARSSFDTFRDSLITTTLRGVDDHQYKAKVDSMFRSSIDESLADYQTKDKQPLSQIIDKNFQAFSATNLDQLRDLINATAQKNKAKDNIFKAWKGLPNTISKTDDAFKKQGLKINLKLWSNVPDSLIESRSVSILDSLAKYTPNNESLVVQNLKNQITTFYKPSSATVATNLAIVDGFIADQINFIVSVSTDQVFSSNIETESLLTADILKYASVDVTALAFPFANAGNNSDSKKAYGGFFFMITPYIQDFVGRNTANGKLPHKAFGLAPSLGVAMFQVLGENPKPIYFLGASARISDAFRLNAGWSLFKNDINDKYFQWMFGFGASLHVAYLGDLLRLLGATTSAANGVSLPSATNTATSSNP